MTAPPPSNSENSCSSCAPPINHSKSLTIHHSQLWTGISLAYRLHSHPSLQNDMHNAGRRNAATASECLGLDR